MEQQDRKESAVRAEAARHKPRLEHWRIISAMLILYDIIAVNAAYLFALLPGILCFVTVAITATYTNERYFTPVFAILYCAIMSLFDLRQNMPRVQIG